MTKYYVIESTSKKVAAFVEYIFVSKGFVAYHHLRLES